MTWQGGAVLAVLVLSVTASRLLKFHPRDLIFAIGALTTPLLGIISSSQIGQSFANPTMLTVLALWFLISAWQDRRFFPRAKTIREKFPLPLLLEIFSAYLFYFACKNSGLDHWISFFLKGLPFWAFLILSFLSAQALAFSMPRPVAFALLFSLVLSLFSGPFLFVATVSIAASLLLNFLLFYRFSLVFFNDLKNN